MLENKLDFREKRAYRLTTCYTILSGGSLRWDQSRPQRKYWGRNLNFSKISLKKMKTSTDDNKAVRRSGNLIDVALAWKLRNYAESTRTTASAKRPINLALTFEQTFSIWQSSSSSVTSHGKCFRIIPIIEPSSSDF